MFKKFIFPQELIDREQWIIWKSVERDGKDTKVPVNPHTENLAQTDNPKTWGDFHTADEMAERDKYGLGFVFTESDPFVGIDLDDVRDPDSGHVSDIAADIINIVDSYTELSPSSTGYHVIAKGSLPGSRNRNDEIGIEMYDDRRFFTMSGNHVAGTPQEVKERPNKIYSVWDEYVREDEKKTTATVDPSEVSNSLDDDQVISRILNSETSDKFKKLWSGDITGYPSQSEADLALCNVLAFWTGGDKQQMDRLFRESELMREKWDESHASDGTTYGELTIEKSLEGRQEYYTGNGRN